MEDCKIVDGFVWLLITEKAKEVYVSGNFEVYALHDDGSESLIEEYDQLIEYQNQGLDFGIEVGFLPNNTNGQAN